MTNTPQPLHSFWAKLGNTVWPDCYHPVICHLIDVGVVTRALWDNVLRRRIRQWVASRLGLDEEPCARWLAFWCGAHDIGKVAPCFQDRGPNTADLKKRLEPEFDFPPGNKPHGELGTKILADQLVEATNWQALDRRVAQNVAVAVGGHHGVFATNWDQIYAPLGNDRWAAARRELLAELARLFGVINIPVPKPTVPNDHSVWMWLAGLTSVADWIGSNQEFFKPVGNADLADRPFNVDDYFGMSQRHAQEALKRLGWLGRTDTANPVTFADLFPFLTEPRPLQTAVAEIVAKITEPSLMIVEAPMGEGKTEAGWYAAACWDRQAGQGAYVALPTMATSNQMFDRVGVFLKPEAGKKNLMLQHGKAALNDQFEKLKYAAQVYDDEKQSSAVVAEGWFAANKKHGLLAPFGVGTIDQALLAVLQTKHVFVRLFGLAGKCVILDEVHAYDAYMTTLMERLLRWLAALGCPVVLLSATLPREKRLKLISAYAGRELPEAADVPYPRVSSVAVGGLAAVTHVEADPARARTVALGWLDEVDVADKLRRSLANGGCAAVIRNTVGLAQETYLRLRDGLKGAGIAVELFHARFPFGRRMDIENAVLKRFGKESRPAERDKQVLVATQVVEQSLDLDFDLMVSDVAPVDLVLQRAGRLHRHERGQRPAGVTEPTVWLIEPEVENGLPDFGDSRFVYSPHILFRSLLALRSDGTGTRDKFHLPSEIDVLVDQVYEDSPVPDSLSPAERDFWKLTRAKHREMVEKEEGEAESRQIKKPQFRGALARVVQEPREEDTPDLHPAHQALTRLTRPTVSLICLNRDDNGSYRLPHDSSLVPTLAIRKMASGGAEDIGRLMLAEVTSAHWGVIRQLRAAPLTPSGWGDVGMLCRHHLIIFTKGKASLGGYELVLDNSLGLTVACANVQGEDE